MPDGLLMLMLELRWARVWMAPPGAGASLVPWGAPLLAGEGEGDADVVVGDIVDVYPQAVGADLIPDMDGGTITVVDAVLEEDAGDANDEASDGGSVSSRKSRTNTTSRRRKKGEGKSSRRDAKSARAAKKREAAKRLPSAPSETESDALASAPEDDEEALQARPAELFTTEDVVLPDGCGGVRLARIRPRRRLRRLRS